MSLRLALECRARTFCVLQFAHRQNRICQVNLYDGSENLIVSSAGFIFREKGILYMAKRRGNPNWGKPEPIGPITPTITEFEQVVREYKLSPDQYLRSTRLREWARRNKNSKYIPEPLLEAWGFEIESTL